MWSRATNCRKPLLNNELLTAYSLQFLEMACLDLAQYRPSAKKNQQGAQSHVRFVTPISIG